MYNTGQMKIQPAKLLIFLISLLIFILVGEIIAAKFLPQKTFRKAYGDAVSCFSPGNKTLFTLKANCDFPFENYDTGEKFNVKTNNLGYRGENFEIEKTHNEKRILVEGDSFVLGFGVKDNEVFSRVLQEKFQSKNVKVINAGYKGGFGPDGYFLHLKNEGMKLAPDLVIFSIFVYNDFTDMVDSDWQGTGVNGEPVKIVSNKIRIDENGYLLPKEIPFIYKIPVLRNSHLAVASSKGLEKVEALWKKVYDTVKFKIFKPEFASGTASDNNFLGTYHSFCIFGDYCHRKSMHLYQDMMTVIKSSRELVNMQFKDGQDHFLVMIIPVEFQVYEDTFPKYQADTGIPLSAARIADPNPQKRLGELFEKEGIKFIDLLGPIRKEKERLYFVKDGHWNSQGHAFTANVLYNWILDNYDSYSAR